MTKKEDKIDFCDLVLKCSGKSFQYYLEREASSSEISKQLIIDILAHSGVEGLREYGFLGCLRILPEDINPFLACV